MILYTASWCKPCQQLKTMLEKDSLLEDIDIVDIDNMSDAIKDELQLRSIPTLNIEGILLNDSIKIYNKIKEIKDK